MRGIKKTLITAAIMMLGASTGLSIGLTPAQAAEPNLVAFGDSVLADPRADIYLQARLSSHQPTGLNCPKSNNFASRTGAKLGLPVADYSCSGAVSMAQGPQISTQVDAAIASGALSPQTQRVLYATGFNDTYNNRNLSQQEIRAKWVAFNAPLIEKIKAAAPNARIQIVGYPTIGTGNEYCLFHFGPSSSHMSLPLGFVRDWEDKAQWMQVDLAAATGTEFVDLKPSTRYNGTCALDNQRMWAGLIDFTGGPGNLPIHVNDRGHEHIANVLASS